MNNLELQLTIDQRTAILAGRAQHGTARVVLTDADLAQMTDHERFILAGLPTTQGNVLLLDGTDTRIGEAPALPKVADASLSTIRSLLVSRESAVQARHKQLQTLRAEAFEAWVAKALAAPDSKWFFGQEGKKQVEPPGYNPIVNQADVHADHRIAPKLAIMQQRADEMNREYQEREEARVAEDERRKLQQEADKANQAEARAEQVKEWVIAHGTPNQQARQERGLLPEQEVIDGIAEQVFTPLADRELFQEITDDDIFDAYGLHPEEDNPFHDSWEAEYLTDEQFATLAEIEQALESHKPAVTVYVHRGRLKNSSEDEDEENQIIRLEARAVVTVGKITVQRRYAM